MLALNFRVAAIQHLPLPSPYFQKILTGNAQGMTWKMQYSSMEIQFPPKQVLCEQPRCWWALPIIYWSLSPTTIIWMQHIQVEQMCCSWLPQIQKSLFILFAKSWLFSSTAILTFYNSIKPDLQLPNYLINPIPFFPREKKSAQFHKYVLQSFTFFPIYIYFN